jgi:hypothetical protein
MYLFLLDVSAAQVKSAEIESHMVVSKDANTLKGTMVLTNSNQDSVMDSKDIIAGKLTEMVQAEGGNANSKVEVNDVRELSDGTLVLDYECTDVSDKSSAKKSLNDAVKQDEVKQAIGNSPSPTVATTSKPPQATSKLSK